MIAMLLFLWSVWILFQQRQCINIGDYPVCKNGTTHELFCCYNFEENNGRCVECKNGYTSTHGNPCKMCAYGKYGHKCLEECNCPSYQLCDNIQGCIDIVYTSLPTTMDTSTGYTADSNTRPRKFHNQTVKTETAYEKEKSYSNEYMLISLPSGIIFVFLIIYIVVSNSLCFMIYRKLKKAQHIITPVPVNLYDEIGTVHYQDISLPQITGQQPESLAHSPVLIPSTTESDKDDSNNVESDSQISQSEFDVNENESHQHGHDEIEGNGTQNEHPYYPFLPPGHYRHVYETCPALADNAEESARTIPEYEHYIDMNI